MILAQGSHLFRIYLNYPIDIVKFDKSLVERILEDDKAKLMLKGLAQMLHSLNITTVAEGVELIDHIEICEEIKISRLQGYYLGVPMSFDKCLVELTKRQFSH